MKKSKFVIPALLASVVSLTGALEAQASMKSESVQPIQNKQVQTQVQVQQQKPVEKVTMSLHKFVSVDNGSRLNLRQSPSTGSSVISKLVSNTEVTVQNEENGWAYVFVNGLKGYVSADFLSGSKQNYTYNKETTVTANNNNQQKETVTQPKQEEKPAVQEKPAVNSSSVTGLALQLVGSRYVEAGTTPNGFDCSGFIYYVYKNNGYSISRQSVAGYWSQAQKISNPQPGDLVFFQNTYKPGPSHMGVYIGNGQFVHAGDESTGVIVSSVNSKYNQAHFLGYGRF